MSVVMVAMSGGVDSAVTAHLAGFGGNTVIGATMKLYCPGKPLHPDENGIMITDEIEDAKAVARKLGIRHIVLDYEASFKDHVVQPFIDSYMAAKTPNPCIECNRTLKFGAMIDAMKAHGADMMATGHYARIERDPSGRYLLRCAADSSKDQSYVLYMLKQEQLAHVMFPLGDYSKAEVRRIAAEMGFVNANKGDSQDICFVPDGDYAGFIERYTGMNFPAGNFINRNGDILGQHKGIIHYTIGQRKGLGIALGKPAFVCHKDAKTNAVTLSDNESLFSDTVFVEKANFIPFDSLHAPLRVYAKVRYNMKAQPAVVEQMDDDLIRLTFDQPQRAITPGQAAVFYDNDYVVGGGIIL